MLELLVFWLLFVWLLRSPQARQDLKNKTPFEWLLDGSNLLIQGFLIPFLRVAVLLMLLKQVWPAGQGLLRMGNGLGFLLCFIGVDYLYYWNHRIFHLRRVFPVHLIHHSVTRMDVMATSRNTLWTSFLIVYLWVNGLMLYLTDLNAGFILAMSLTACLDMWKHSNLLQGQPALQQILSKYLGLMTPLEHAWHHSHKLNQNFGANFNLFDKLHGTYTSESAYPERLGVSVAKLKPWQQLLFPFQARP
jgi:sterol desaturase/sphingolipid hydroxylase (fatty acid hydroxylase superfamily)